MTSLDTGETIDTKLFWNRQAYKEGYEPFEADFQVVDSQPTDINIVLYKAVRPPFFVSSDVLLVPVRSFATCR